MRNTFRRLFFGLLLTSNVVTAHGATFLVAPNSNTAVPGTSNTYLFGNGIDSEARIQWAFPASEFVSLSPGTAISSIGFRFCCTLFSLPPLADYSQWNLQLSKSVNAVPNLSPTFSSNIGFDAVLVRSGALTISSVTSGSFFDINFTTPYLYTGGDLLMTLSWVGSSSNAIGVEANNVDDGHGNTNVSFDASALTGTTGFFNYPITRFGIADVPEPTTFLLLCLGLVAIRLSLSKTPSTSERLDLRR